MIAEFDFAGQGRMSQSACEKAKNLMGCVGLWQ
jgi:hypothetical protein